MTYNLVKEAKSSIIKLLAKLKEIEQKSEQAIKEEDEKLVREYTEIQRNMETEKQKIHKRVTDQVKLIYK